MRLIALSLLIFANTLWAADFEPPAYRRPVMDEAHLMSESGAQSLSERLEKLYQSGGSQIGVLTVESLNGVPIESAGIQTAEKWKLGTAKGDNGVILLISKGDRSVRIEVGQGLEGALPDIYAKRIIDDVIVPRFREKDFEGGIVEGVVMILKYTDPDYHSLDQNQGGGRFLRRGGLAALLVWMLFNHPVILIFLIFFLFSLFGRRRYRRSFWTGSGWGGGGYGGGFGGGGFGGGGGFSGGGGGGFSGGGASGRW